MIFLGTNIIIDAVSGAEADRLLRNIASQLIRGSEFALSVQIIQ